MRTNNYANKILVYLIQINNTQEMHLLAWSKLFFYLGFCFAKNATNCVNTNNNYLKILIFFKWNNCYVITSFFCCQYTSASKHFYSMTESLTMINPGDSSKLE